MCSEPDIFRTYLSEEIIQGSVQCTLYIVVALFRQGSAYSAGLPAAALVRPRPSSPQYGIYSKIPNAVNIRPSVYELDFSLIQLLICCFPLLL
jgi:hypothetical protein